MHVCIMLYRYPQTQFNALPVDFEIIMIIFMKANRLFVIFFTMRLNNLNNIIRKISDICCILDKEGNIRAINEPMLKHCRAVEHNVLRKNFAEVFFLPNKEQFAAELALAYATKEDRYFSGFNDVYKTSFNISINYVEEYLMLIIRCEDMGEKEKVDERDWLISNRIESTNWIKAIMENLPTSIVMVDLDMNVIAATNKWLETYSLELIDIIGRNFYEIFPNLPEERREIHQRCLHGATERKENDVLVVDGHNKFNVNWEIRPWRKTNGTIGGIILFSEIINEGDKKKKMLFRLFRELNLLIEVIDNIITATDEFEMIEHVCKKIVQIGGYQLVWFGYVPDVINEKKFISPLHKFGQAIHYLDNFIIDLNNEVHKNGPVARAAAQLWPVVVNDISVSQIFTPWKVNAQVHNLNSIISIPLKLLDSKVAILNIYSSEKNRFTEEEVKILGRLGSALAYSMNGLQRAYENKVALLKQGKLIKDLNIQNRSLEDFTYVVSHNLRSKVVNLLNATCLIEDEGCLTEEENKNMISEVRNISVKLDEVMKDLNSTLLVKEHIVLNAESVRFSGLVARVQQKLEAEYQAGNYELETDFSAIDEIRSDGYFLYETLLQLLQGIIKQHTNNDIQRIAIKSILLPDKVRIIVTDHVSGAKLMFAENNIFDIYRRLYQHTSQGGIKLFYVNAIIENLGGKLYVETIGSNEIVFTIELPVD